MHEYRSPTSQLAAGGDHEAGSVLSIKLTEGVRLSGNIFSRTAPKFGSTMGFNRRFRKQIGGLLIRGSEVRILPGALARGQEVQPDPWLRGRSASRARDGSSSPTRG